RPFGAAVRGRRRRRRRVGIRDVEIEHRHGPVAWVIQDGVAVALLTSSLTGSGLVGPAAGSVVGSWNWIVAPSARIVKFPGPGGVDTGGTVSGRPATERSIVMSGSLR